MTHPAPSHIGSEPEPLVVRTVAVPLPTATALVELLPDPSDQPDSVAWLRRGEGLVGWGVAARVRTTGTDRFADADAWWSAVTGHAVVRDEVGEPGTGLVTFGSFGFADEPGDSTLVVPEVVIGRQGERAWVTTVSASGLRPNAEVPAPSAEPPTPGEVTFGDGALDGSNPRLARGAKGPQQRRVGEA